MNKKGRSTKQVLEVNVDITPKKQLLTFLEERIKAGNKTFVVTVNPEMVMLAQEDHEFKRILNSADVSICDGIGLRLADPSLIKITGRELMLALIKKGYTYYLAGGKPGDPDPDIKAINRARPDLLFVGLGHGKQEKWIFKNLPKLKVKLAMGVGGAIDQLNDPKLVAPQWVQNLGLEWLYRLIVEPWRIKRQWQLVRFLAKIMKER